METKTKKQWSESKQNLSKFLNVGDIVDDEMYYYFLEVLPPACNSPTCLQLGEPYSHCSADNRPTFFTLEKIDGNWVYVGIKPTPKTEKCLYVQ